MKTIKQILLTIAVLLLSLTANAYDFEVDGIYYNIISVTDSTVKVTGGDNKYIGEIIIPSTIIYKSRTLKVVAVGDQAFNDCDSLTNITIPNTVTSIGEYAFSGCSGLANITIPNSVTTIENFAFNGCTSLKELHIEDGETILELGYSLKYNGYSNGRGLFIDCPLEGLYLGRNLSYKAEKDYGYSPFCNKTILTSVTIGNNVTNIGEFAFSGCSGLANITIPNCVTTIENCAFNDCTSLKELHIEDGETILELGYNKKTNIKINSEGLFYDCPLKKVHLGRTVAYMVHDNYYYYGNSPFYNRKDLKTLTISNYVTAIGDNAFEGCSDLSEIIIPNSVTSIGYEAFQGCTGLTNVTIGNSVTSIGEHAFCDCTGLTSITIPNNVTKIGSFAFDYCTSLKELYIEDGDLTLSWGEHGTYGDYFGHCPIEKVYLGRNFVFKGDKDWLFSIISNRISSLTIGNCVTGINNKVFRNFAQDISIYLMCVIPPTIGEKGDADYVNWNIYVPKGTIEIYQATDVWKNFWNIQEHSLIEYHTVTYRVDGEIYETQLVALGDTIPTIDEPTKEGYTFSGWSEVPETMPAEDITITGSFSVNTYKITYIVDGEVYATDSLAYGSEIVLIEGPTKEGYTFSGWSEAPETMPAEDITITGSFSVNTYAITYIVDGEVYVTDELTYGSEIVLIDEPTKEGYTFSGWSEVPETMPAEDITITGSFSVNTYTITYIVDGEVYATDSLTYGSEIVLRDEPTKEGYTFSGWSEAPETMPAEDIEITGSFIPTENVSEVEMDVNVQTTNNGIILLNAYNNVVRVYSINGILVEKIDKYTGEEIVLNKGVYIVCVGDKAVKIKL
ncbi:MAG: leucine-rich repeat protein [Bacteroidales bacterium]|nr:leucine-rich repeat protein [Bacteroidales bacterium]